MQQNACDKEIPIIRLIGDPEENFYQLGVKDRETAEFIREHIENIFSLSWDHLNKFLFSLYGPLAKNLYGRNATIHQWSNAYVDGLGLKDELFYRAMAIPEFMSALSKWFPALPFTQMGCSSFFAHDQDWESPIHARILDFPLVGSFDKHERVLMHEFKNYPKIFSFGAAGFPYPSMTAMNDQGISVAIHQKYTDVLNLKGTPIFELVFEILLNCSNCQDVINLLKKSQSITTWGLYFSFKSGEILRADIMGDRLIHHKDRPSPSQILYFNNILEDKNIDQTKFIPHGFHEFCQMRKKIAHKKILKLQHSRRINDEKLLITSSTRFEQKGQSAASWKMDCLTPVSVGAYVMNAKEGRALAIPGDAPKYYQGQTVEFSNIWKAEGPTVIAKSKKIAPRSLDLDHVKSSHRGLNYLMLGQKAIDYGELEKAYHYIQIAQDYLKDCQEFSLAQFFFLVLQYLHEPDREVLSSMQASFELMIDHLPPNLKNHCRLFIIRILREGVAKDQKQSNTFLDEIDSPFLKQIAHWEEKFPIAILRRMIRATIHIRMEVFDIIYGHIR